MNEKYLKTEQLLHSTEKFCIKLGLERIAKILELLGNPQDKINIIHVAGTNGKGSVCTIASEILKLSGYKTALYTSPHLFKYNERFKINGIDISDEDFCTYTNEINKLAEKNNIDLTEFEILTASAYKYFYDNKVDFAVMETGLGGRFDAVNIVKQPVLTAITSVSIDHKDRLGDTIEKIAFEKAGIIKNNIPLVINYNNKGFDIIKNIAKEKKALIIKTEDNVKILFENGINYAICNNEKYEFNLWGLHQKQNLEIVFKIIDYLKKNGCKITVNNISNALKQAFIPARFQYNEKYNLLIDGAHNIDAVKILKKNLEYYFPQINKKWIYGTISTKEYKKITNMLFQDNDTVFLPEFTHPLAVSYEKITKNFQKNNKIIFKKISKTENILNYFDTKSLIIITGSFYMIGDILSPNVIL